MNKTPHRSGSSKIPSKTTLVGLTFLCSRWPGQIIPTRASAGATESPCGTLRHEASSVYTSSSATRACAAPTMWSSWPSRTSTRCSGSRPSAGCLTRGSHSTKCSSFIKWISFFYVCVWGKLYVVLQTMSYWGHFRIRPSSSIKRMGIPQSHLSTLRKSENLWSAWNPKRSHPTPGTSMTTPWRRIWLGLSCWRPSTRTELKKWSSAWNRKNLLDSDSNLLLSNVKRCSPTPSRRWRWR